MKVNELRDKIAELDGDIEITCLVSNHSSDLKSLEVRDCLHPKTHEFQHKTLVLGNQKSFGWPELTEEEYQKRSREFMEGFSRGSKRYTTIHGDHRIYNDFGGSQDTCYGIAYDPRIIKRLVDEGYLEFFKQPCSIDGVIPTKNWFGL